jgi:hypothetical protein
MTQFSDPRLQERDTQYNGDDDGDKVGKFRNR